MVSHPWPLLCHMPIFLCTKFSPFLEEVGAPLRGRRLEVARLRGSGCVTKGRFQGSLLPVPRGWPSPDCPTVWLQACA